MIKIVGEEIVDLIPFPSGILFVLKEGGVRESSKISFYSFDLTTKSIATVTKNAYLLTKFGSAFSPIAAQLEDYVSCDAAKLWNGYTFVIYSSGEIGIFDEQGTLVKTDDIVYRDSPARDVAVDNNFVWCAVPDQNLIIKYSLQQNRVVLRIGGDSSTTFSRPASVDEYDGSLYICNPGSFKIRKMDLADYSIEDYREFDEPVYKYIKIGEHEFVILASGVYLL